MRKVIFINDFFYEEVGGGAEAVTDNLYDYLSHGSSAEQFLKLKSDQISPQVVEKNKEAFFIVANFVNLSSSTKDALLSKDYVIYEHDHKYLTTRDPSTFEDFLAPSSAICDKKFYACAKAIICQSSKHAQVVQSNLLLDNIVNAGCSLWKKEDLDLLESLVESGEKKEKRALLASNNCIKGMQEAMDYCKLRKLNYELIEPMQYHPFLKKLSTFKEIVFFSQVLETFCRIVVEARMLNCDLITNHLNGCASEKWFLENKGQDLINIIRKKQSSVVQIFKDLIKGEFNSYLPPIKFPTVSIITSVYNGDKYIESFLKDITAQSVFTSCELILINANSPGNEFSVIQKYIKKYPHNIKYIKLDNDPGIYATWNVGLENASGEFITNANLDDRRSPFHIEEHIRYLLHHKDIDLVYSSFFMTNMINETFEDNSSQGVLYPSFEFSLPMMVKCLPGCMPVWRKSMHEKYGLFDKKYKYAGDWEMWLRAAKEGAKFKKIPEVLGLYYHNPDGLSTSEHQKAFKLKEETEIFWNYIELFGNENRARYENYFPQESSAEK